eukprot:scaffold4601_cov146-Ochromonas_danica.AAC.5
MLSEELDFAGFPSALRPDGEDDAILSLPPLVRPPEDLVCFYRLWNRWMGDEAKGSAGLAVHPRQLVPQKGKQVLVHDNLRQILHGLWPSQQVGAEVVLLDFLGAHQRDLVHAKAGDHWNQPLQPHWARQGKDETNARLGRLLEALRWA